MVALSSVLLGWFGMRMRRAEMQRRAVAAIQRTTQTIDYDYQLEGNGKLSPRFVAWLADYLGHDFFESVVAVRFRSRRDATRIVVCNFGATLEGDSFDRNETQITDAGLAHLRELAELRQLDLHDTQVTNIGLEPLRGLRRLELLNLSGTHVTDEGLRHLNGLTELKHLDLRNTRVTGQGVLQLREALRLCTIYWDDTLDKVSLKGTAETIQKRGLFKVTGKVIGMER